MDKSRRLTATLTVTALLSGMTAVIAADAKPPVQRAEIEMADSAGFYLTMTSAEPIRVDVVTEQGAAKYFTIELKPQTFTPLKPSWKLPASKIPPELLSPVVFTNHVVSMRGLGIDYFVCPNTYRYTDDLKLKYYETWRDMPNALSYRMFFDFRAVTDGIQLYIDGKYAAFFPGDNHLKKVAFSGTCLPNIEESRQYRNKHTSELWEVADLSFIGNSGAMSNDTVSLPGGEQTVEGVPLHVLTPANSLDIGRAEQTRGIWALEVDCNLSRTAFERLPEAFITSVPNAYYDQAAVLFALDPDPAKDRAMTLRVTRFCSEGRGEGHIHDDIVFPKEGEPMPDNIKQVGTVKHKAADGSETEIPLYLGYFPLDSGEILDIINEDPHPTSRQTIAPYLDVEIFARRNSNVGAYMSGMLKPVAGVVSAVNVFGLSLRRAPAEFRLSSAAPAFIFVTEEPEMTASITGVRAGRYKLAWTVYDSNRNRLKYDEGWATMKSGETQDIKIVPPVYEIGHYYIEFALYEIGKTNSLFLTHKAMFAITGPDTRKATKAVSPFGCGWWCGPHHTCADPELCFNIMHKAGIHKTSLQLNKMTPAAAAAVEKYQMTLPQIPNPTNRSNYPLDNPEEAEKMLAEYFDPLFKAFPDCKQVRILHESYGDPMPEELLGKTPPEAGEREKTLVKRATIAAKFLRKHYPYVKLVYGNNTSSSGVMAMLFRNGYDPKLVDYIGIETPGQGCIPERLWRGGTQGTWFAKEVARHFGYNIPVTGCAEFTSRPLRLLGMTMQAEYKIRDALVGFAHGYDYVEIVLLSDVANGYLQTVWGTDGMLSRYPLHYPKPLFSAMAAMTRALDRIELNPQIIDTGANTTYALEFKRKDNKFAYACWVPVGEAVLAFEFPEETEIEQIDFLGKTAKRAGGKFQFGVGTGPRYLVTSTSATSVRHVRTVANKPPEQFKTAEKLDSLDGFRVMGGIRNLNGDDMYRLPGVFEFKQVKDPERGDCVEVKLVKQGEIKAFETEYTKIQFKKPTAIEGTPDEIGMWVYGDGGWGKIGFEIQDAEGRLHRSEGQWNDFGADTYIAFTGWRFIRFPIDGIGVKEHLNQSLGARWFSNPKTPITYPIKITGLYITLTRQALSPAEMKEVSGVIRIKDLGTIANPDYQQ